MSNKYVAGDGASAAEGGNALPPDAPSAAFVFAPRMLVV